MVRKGNETMFEQEVAWLVAGERLRQSEHRARIRRELGDRPARRSMRRSLGRSLMQIGERLAADGSFQPATQR